jgi:hypothetical protein
MPPSSLKPTTTAPPTQPNNTLTSQPSLNRPTYPISRRNYTQNTPTPCFNNTSRLHPQIKPCVSHLSSPPSPQKPFICITDSNHTTDSPMTPSFPYSNANYAYQSFHPHSITNFAHYATMQTWTHMATTSSAAGPPAKNHSTTPSETPSLTSARKFFPWQILFTPHTLFH